MFLEPLTASLCIHASRGRHRRANSLWLIDGKSLIWPAADAYTQRRISHKFTTAEKNYNEEKHANRKLRPAVRDQCWVDPICKPFDLFCFVYVLLLCFCFIFVSLQVCLRRMESSIYEAIHHLARLRCREESK